MLFYRLVEQAVKTAPLTYRQIVDRKHNMQGALALSGDPLFGIQDLTKGLDERLAAMQHCSMTAISVSKRGTITLPPEIRRGLGLEMTTHPMMLVELRDGGVFLQPAEALPVRDIPEATLREWVEEDERDAEGFWKRAGMT